MKKQQCTEENSRVSKSILKKMSWNIRMWHYVLRKAIYFKYLYLNIIIKYISKYFLSNMNLKLAKALSITKSYLIKNKKNL